MARQRRLVRVLIFEIFGCMALAASAAFVWYRQAATADMPPVLTAVARPTLAVFTPKPPPLVTLAPAATHAQPPTAIPLQATRAATAAALSFPKVTGQVLSSVNLLNLRQSPGTAGKVIKGLAALTKLTVVGRTDGNAWFEVDVPDGKHGWVSASYVELTAGDPGKLAITGSVVDATPAASTGSAGSIYLSGVTAHAREIFVAGQALGNHDYAFSMVGDSNSDNPAFMLPFDLGQYNLGAYADLAPSVTYFAGSFSRDSAAALGGFSTSKVLDPALADGRCQAGESPLACEYRLQKPSVALILLGTGDQHSWQGFEGRYRQIVEYTIGQGIVPVLMTKADDLESRENTATPGFINDVIRRLAQEYDVPLLDVGAAVAGLPNHGCVADGFHYNSPPDGQTATFDGEHLQYGFNVRNLTALQALDALRRYVLYSL